ncbi:MAG: ATP-binding protein [Actinomycetota bacterium]|nr:ATP-binding protein [Actinomycetota bacterium]
MSAFRSVGARLSLALLLVVAIALGLVYFVVVPSLEDRLVNSKLGQLAKAAPRLDKQYQKNPFDPDFFTNAAANTDARVILLELISTKPPTVITINSSLPGQSDDAYVNDPVALRAAQTLTLQKGTVKRKGERFAEVAVPVRGPGSTDVLLLSAPLHDTLANVHSVQRRLLVAGALALLVALAIGYGAASLFARRIRRLERAAGRIAVGQFDEPIVDSARDELGELARGFERMRVQLAQLDHARREFVANASHELRTPLFSLGGFLELFEDEDLDEPTRREFVATMRGQVDRLTKLAQDLLDLTRFDAGRLYLERQPVDLAALAADLAAEFAPLARSENRPLEAKVAGPVTALADEQRVLQIGRILLENALVHTPEGTQVRVEAAQDGGEAVLSVSNDGPEIPSDHAGHLFERFYRVDGTRASGSGLGLAIARELAELMDGTVEVESSANETKFSLRLRSTDAPPTTKHVKTERSARENGSERAETPLPRQ